MPNEESDARYIYECCYRAWRLHENWRVANLWKDHRDIYRAAGDSFVANVSDLYGWVNLNRRWEFVCRRMDVQNARR